MAKHSIIPAMCSYSEYYNNVVLLAIDTIYSIIYVQPMDHITTWSKKQKALHYSKNSQTMQK